MEYPKHNQLSLEDKINSTRLKHKCLHLSMRNIDNIHVLSPVAVAINLMEGILMSSKELKKEWKAVGKLTMTTTN